MFFVNSLPRAYFKKKLAIGTCNRLIILHVYWVRQNLQKPISFQLILIILQFFAVNPKVRYQKICLHFASFFDFHKKKVVLF